MESIAFILILLGLFVRFKKFFISGEEKKNISAANKNSDKISGVIGTSFIMIGLIIALMPAAIYFMHSRFPFYIFTGIMIVVIISMFIRIRDYQKK
jgi:hypothetical protein